MKLIPATLVFILLAGSAHAASDLLISGGPIYTGLAGQPTVEAIVIHDGRIAFAGKADEAKTHAVGARVIDLKGAAAYPGFVDAHAHLSGIGFREITLNLETVSSVAMLISTVADYAKQHPDGALTGRGWIETHWPEKRFPTRADLDKAESTRPVWLMRSDGHAGVANSAALKLAGIDRNTPDPAGGRIEHDASGEPTGMLIDGAKTLVSDKMPAPTPAQLRVAMERAVALYASRGWTGLDNMSVAAEDVATLEAMAREGKLPIRVDNFMDVGSADKVLASGPYEDPTGLVRVRGIKLYADGALGSRGAALLAPYANSPTNGLIITPPDKMAAYLKRARDAHVQVAVHAIGDRGNRMTLDAYRNALAGTDSKQVRWRIEHAQILAPTDLPRFAAMGIIASMQPSHAIGDFYFAPARLGETRLKGAYAWNSLLASGAVVTAGSDAPVEKGDPLIEFYAATYRHDLKGFAAPNWHLEEAVSRAQALTMLTSAPAFAVFHETELGTLAVGKRADITAFSVDLMKAQPAAIPTAHAVLTVVNGNVVYQAP